MCVCVCIGDRVCICVYACEHMKVSSWNVRWGLEGEITSGTGRPVRRVTEPGARVSPLLYPTATWSSSHLHRPYLLYPQHGCAWASQSLFEDVGKTQEAGLPQGSFQGKEKQTSVQCGIHVSDHFTSTDR